MKASPISKHSRPRRRSKKPFFKKHEEEHFFSPEATSVKPFFNPARKPRSRQGKSDDRFEREADRVAGQIVSDAKQNPLKVAKRIESPKIQRNTATAVGAAIGAVVGAAAGGIPGAVIGSVVGGLIGAYVTALKTKLRSLISANNTNYADYKAAILAASFVQKFIALIDRQLLRDLKGQLSWNDWARCIELLGRKAPTYDQLRRDSTVTAALDSAWTASNPAIPGPGTTQHEEGGWIYMNLITGNLTTRSAPVGAGASINLSHPPNVADSIVVGMFHTHPNLGPGWTPGPSPADQRLDTRDGVPDIVVGSPNTDATTYRFYLSGPAQRTHLAGNQGLPGTAGGIAPQAKADRTYDER